MEDERNEGSLVSTAAYVAIGLSVINVLIITYFVYVALKGTV